MKNFTPSLPKDSLTVSVGPLSIGGKHPVIIQSMTNTDTSDVEATTAQILELYEAGAQIIRVTINNKEAAKAIPTIKEKLFTHFYSSVLSSSTSSKKQNLIHPATPGKKEMLPLAIVGDFHFNGNKLLKKFPECAKTLDKYRINPGNADDENFRETIEMAIKYDKPVRIGVNGGSLDPRVLEELMDLNALSPHPLDSETIFVQAMVKSALDSAKLAESYGLRKNQIVISVKASEVNQMVKAYRLVAQKSNYCLHLGLTESGSGLQGIVASSVALGILLKQGIGDTIRVSLTPNKETPRTTEVEVCKQILQSLGLKRFRPKITSCPGCGRTSSTFFQELAFRVNKLIDQKMSQWRDIYPGVEKLNIAVMGCVVNGPGESKNADIAISLPGKMEKAQAPVYVDGKLKYWLKGNDIEEKFLEILEQYIRDKYG